MKIAPMMQSVRVLICDDEPDIRTLYRHAFELHGADVEEATDGDEAIASVTEHHPDLVVLDLFMPGRDGLSALPDLKRASPQSRVLIVSAHPAVEVFDQARSHGATACFDKLSFLPRIATVIERFGPRTNGGPALRAS